MAGMILVPDAVERMRLFDRRLYGEWPGFSVDPDVDYGVFPDALVAQGLRHSHGTMSSVAGPAGSETLPICSMGMPSVTGRMKFGTRNWKPIAGR